MSQVSDENVNPAGHRIRSTPDGLGRLLAEAQQNKRRAPPPLEKWHPAYCGEMDLRIDAQGEWWHEGSRMTRQSLVDLFATVLWREDMDGVDRYFLKTPVEKIGIVVDDVPLLVVDVEQSSADDGQSLLHFRTKNGDVVTADAEHPIFMREFNGQMRPYLTIRRNLDALIHRNAFYHLIDLGEWVETASGLALQVQSGTQVFSLG